MKKLIALSALLATNCFASVDATVTINPTTGYKNQYFNIYSTHTVSITNGTLTAQPYDYFFSLCPQVETCTNQNRHVILQSGQNFTDKITLTARAMYHVAGHFPVYASTGIAGIERLSRQANSSSTVY